MDHKGSAHHNQSGSGLVTNRPCTLYCINITVENDGDYIEVYDGRDTTSGSKVVKVACLEDRIASFNISRGVYCDNGLYVHASATDCEWSVFFQHLEVSPQHIDA